MELLSKDILGLAISSTIEMLSSSRMSKNVLFLWEMIILGYYELSFLERLSSSRSRGSTVVHLRVDTISIMDKNDWSQRVHFSEVLYCIALVDKSP